MVASQAEVRGDGGDVELSAQLGALEPVKAAAQAVFVAHNVAA